MVLSDLHNNILNGSEHLGALHFLNEPVFQQAIRGFECYSTFYALVHKSQEIVGESVDDMGDEKFFEIMKAAAVIATKNISEAENMTEEVRLNVILANMCRDEDFVAFDNVDHGLFQLH